MLNKLLLLPSPTCQCQLKSDLIHNFPQALVCSLSLLRHLQAFYRSLYSSCQVAQGSSWHWPAHPRRPQNQHTCFRPQLQTTWKYTQPPPHSRGGASETCWSKSYIWGGPLYSWNSTVVVAASPCSWLVWGQIPPIDMPVIKAQLQEECTTHTGGAPRVPSLVIGRLDMGTWRIPTALGHSTSLGGVEALPKS